MSLGHFGGEAMRTGVHLRTRPNVLGRGGELPRSLGAAHHLIPEGADHLAPGTQVALGRIQIPVLGLLYEPASGDLDWWDALISAATEVRNDLAKLQANEHAGECRAMPR